VLYERNWTRLVHEQLRRFETNVVAAAKVEGYDGKQLLDADRQWSFSGALLYSVTVITTIGAYSCSVPGLGRLAPQRRRGSHSRLADGGHVFSLCPLAWKIPRTHFRWRLEGLDKLQHFSHLVGSRTRDLPACGIAPRFHSVRMLAETKTETHSSVKCGMSKQQAKRAFFRNVGEHCQTVRGFYRENV
jgi:Zn ribbon nucleic-acid-binding protein